MTLGQLVNIPAVSVGTVKTAAPSTGNGGSPASGVGVFVSAQSLTTFPVASSLVTVIWKVLVGVGGSWADSRILPLIISLVVGLSIYLVSADKGATAKDRLASILIALFNSFTLAAAALGIDSVTNGVTPTSGP